MLLAVEFGRLVVVWCGRSGRLGIFRERLAPFVINRRCTPIAISRRGRDGLSVNPADTQYVSADSVT